MIRITISGMDTATSGDLVVKDARAPIHKLARELEAAGADPRDYVEVWRGDTICFHAQRLGWWAAHTTTEGENTSVKTVKYRPFNSGAFA